MVEWSSGRDSSDNGARARSSFPGVPCLAVRMIGAARVGRLCGYASLAYSRAATSYYYYHHPAPALNIDMSESGSSWYLEHSRPIHAQSAPGQMTMPSW